MYEANPPRPRWAPLLGCMAVAMAAAWASRRRLPEQARVWALHPALSLLPLWAWPPGRSLAVNAVAGEPSQPFHSELPLDLPARQVLPGGRRRVTPLKLEDDMSQDSRSAAENLEQAFEEKRQAEAARNAYWRGGALPPLKRREADWTPRPRRIPSFGGLVHSLSRLGRTFLYGVDRLVSLLLLPFLHRKVRWGLVMSAGVIVLWSSGTARSAIRTAAATAGRPLRDRAAFTWREYFETPMVIQGLALHEKTAALTNYEMTFQAKVTKKSIGWVVRAGKPDSYYVFKLIERGRERDALKFDLIRYPVTGGRAAARSEQQSAPVVIQGPQDGYLEIAVRVTEEQILTQVNGFGVDTWKKPKLNPGGWGFLAENGDSFTVRSLTVSGNEDFLGLFLYGAEETLKSVKKTISRPGDRPADPPASGNKAG